MDDGPEPLPGERVLWTGRPGRTGPGGARTALFALWGTLGVAAAVLALLQWRAIGVGTVPGAVLGAGTVVQVGLQLHRTLVREPAERRTQRYAVTDRRLVVQGASGTETWWLDGLPEPAIAGGELVFAGSSGGTAALRAPEDGEAALAALRQGRAAAAGAPVAPAVPAPVPAPALPDGFRPAAWERVLWTGRPGADRRWFRTGDAEGAVPGVLVVALALALGAEMPPPVAVVAVLFAVAALVVGPGRPLLRRLRERRTVHLLTDRRLVSVRVGRSQPVADVRLSALRRVAVVRGTVVLDPGGAAPGRGPVRRAPEPLCLEGVDDPDAVARLIALARLAAPGARPVGASVPQRGAQGTAGREDDEDGAWNRWT